MPDPLSVIGSVSALCSIIDGIAKTISKANELCTRWKNAELAFLSLAAQLTALRTALTKIEEWTDNDIEDFHHQLIMDLDCSLSSCKVVVARLNGLFCALERTTDQELNVTSKIHIVFRTHGLEDLQRMIERQISALNLLLTACTCTTLSNQTRLLQREESRKVLDRDKSESVSLMVHRDANSLISKWSDNLSNISAIFSFDREIFSSKVYERALRSSYKKHLKRRRRTSHRYRFVLLGDDECGKADFIDLFHAEYGRRFSAKELVRCRSRLQDDLRKDCYRCLREEVRQMDEHGTAFASSKAARSVRRLFADNVNPDNAITNPKAFAKMVDNIWQDSSVQSMVREDQNNGKIPPLQSIVHQARRLESQTFMPTAAEIFRGEASHGEQYQFEMQFEMPFERIEALRVPNTVEFSLIPGHEKPHDDFWRSWKVDVLPVLVVDVATYDAKPSTPRQARNQVVSALETILFIGSLRLKIPSMIIILNNLGTFKEKFSRNPTIKLGPLVHEFGGCHNPSAKAIEWMNCKFRQAYQGNVYREGNLYIYDNGDSISSMPNLAKYSWAGLEEIRVEKILDPTGIFS